jgi:hypothetical protein
MNNLINIFPTTFNGAEVIIFFFKIFSCLFSLIFVVYAIIIDRQIKTMAKTIQIIDSGVVQRENLIILITKLQIFTTLLLFIFSLFVLFS